jgi:hypothetical protein
MARERMSSSPLRSAAGCAVSNADSRIGVAVMTTWSMSAAHEGALTSEVVRRMAGEARKSLFMAHDLLKTDWQQIPRHNGRRDL